ncbi:alpha-hydroxy-acid oxidizing protein [Pseudomonas sp. AOB-7]|uniref:alpha-hydroxy acid oxidase n=1 Tax=Pseudomonas sp. AOB-7 TaxID=2482750 RepID=UPI000EFC632F|nr:alpha-hydroxy acid oxidase [Pseudomonas sp. AOB-7]RMH85317.1 alpha-hydroxy-acid oxidizing protein [Pseudomonas sp. AOB-7]
MPLPKLQQIPAEIAALADYERFARERLSEQAWAYLAGGAADELTLADNRAAFDRLRLRSRVLRDLSGGNTRLRLFGQDFDHPIFLAPVAYQKLAHPDGELASVLAAGAVRAGMLVSTQASVELETIAAAAQTPLWFQLYIQPDRDFTAALVRRAEAAGYQALVLTVDAPVSGVRNREQRAGFALPAGVEAVNLRGMRPLQASIEPPAGSLLLGGPLLAAAPTWADLAWLRGLTRLPILLKGIMSGADAEQALAAGMDGLIVSNHGGRSLDGLPATIEALPEVAAAVQKQVPLLLDGGIRRGSDVLKALALGADGVLVGRPYVFGLAAAGAVGVAHVLQMLRGELEVAMALTGCRDLASIGAETIWRPA